MNGTVEMEIKLGGCAVRLLNHLFFPVILQHLIVVKGNDCKMIHIS